ncbi:malate synthase A [Barrientosiimonas marina]|uniref:Malate synthase n=1 Tax=Lentibacillus kimchii TaxID=1542911 RepID=A0ABW2UY36_9BACI
MFIKHDQVRVHGDLQERYDEVLTEGALSFLTKLHKRFDAKRNALLLERSKQQEAINQGERLDFLPGTTHVREGDWTIADMPEELHDRRVEITGSVDRKMVINALNSGAKKFMADFEDATSPVWENLIDGHINLKDAIRRQIDFVGHNGKAYQLNDDPAVLMVRPRGWHMDEKHITVGGEPISASLADFGLYFFHNAQELMERGSGPYFYLPKLESHQEARLWNDVFIFAQEELGIPYGTIKATVLIETITAAFEMDEILYELRDHSAGLNCGRWDYIFSFIKKFKHYDDALLPDRATVTMEVPFMHAYSLLAIQTCHKRNAPAIGGMAAHIPVKNDPEANSAAFAKVRADKEREVRDGHDGTWIAHPGMAELVRDVFDSGMGSANQIHRKREDIQVSREDLLEVPSGKITEQGLYTNVTAGIHYMASWLGGRGAVPINHLMEDAATAEISRAQVWQWIQHPRGILEDGRKVTRELVGTMIDQEMGSMHPEAAALFRRMVSEETFPEFLTLPAYDQLIEGETANG